MYEHYKEKLHIHHFWELKGEPTWISQDLFLDFMYMYNKDPTILHKFILKSAFLSNEICKKAMQWKDES